VGLLAGGTAFGGANMEGRAFGSALVPAGLTPLRFSMAQNPLRCLAAHPRDKLLHLGMLLDLGGIAEPVRQLPAGKQGMQLTVADAVQIFGSRAAL
jgi:hypothetical protein